ncbi:MAG: hypothetical protein ACPGR8_09755 [Limisphaerales bacterium]
MAKRKRKIGFGPFNAFLLAQFLRDLPPFFAKECERRGKLSLHDALIWPVEYHE